MLLEPCTTYNTEFLVLDSVNGKKQLNKKKKNIYISYSYVVYNCTDIDAKLACEMSNIGNSPHPSPDIPSSSLQLNLTDLPSELPLSSYSKKRRREKEHDKVVKKNWQFKRDRTKKVGNRREERGFAKKLCGKGSVSMFLKEKYI